MRRSKQLRWSLLGILLLLGSMGCTGSNSFGLTPQYELLKQAELLRHDEAVEAPRELSKVALADYRVEPGDGLLVLPVDLESPARIPSDQTVLPDGTIDLAQYGRPSVIGKTTSEIETIVGDLVKAKTPNAGFIDVRLINRVSKVFYVVGEVNTPGIFPYTGRETVLDAILTAGGLTDKASTRKIILSRPSDPCNPRTVLRVCWREIVQLGDTSTNYQLQPGDRIYVATAGMFDSLCSPDKICGCHSKSLLARLSCAPKCDVCGPTVGTPIAAIEKANPTAITATSPAPTAITAATVTATPTVTPTPAATVSTSVIKETDPAPVAPLVLPEVK